MKPARIATLRAVSGPYHAVAPPPIVIQGFRSHFDRTRPPVIVNLVAEADALMSWGIEQLAAVNQLLAAVASSDVPGEGHTLAAAVSHLTAQAETALRAALQVHRDSFID